MTCDLDAEAEVMTACALCPNENCGALVLSYRDPGASGPSFHDFLCSRCGTEFSPTRDQLVFQSVPLEYLLNRAA